MKPQLVYVTEIFSQFFVIITFGLIYKEEQAALKHQVQDGKNKVAVYSAVTTVSSNHLNRGAASIYLTFKSLILDGCPNKAKFSGYFFPDPITYLCVRPQMAWQGLFFTAIYPNI